MARAVRAAGGPVHEQAATSLQVLRLPGHRDNVTAKQIGNYFHKGAREPSLKKKGGGVLRWCGRALVDVAELVWRHGPELRAAMQGKLDAQPSAAEELEQTRRERDQQQLLAEEVRRQKEEAHAEAERAKEAHRKLKERGQEQRKAARAKAAKEKTAAVKSAKDTAKARATERAKEARARLLQQAREKAAAEAAEKQAKLQRAVAAARARARKVEAQAKLSGKRLRRAQKAEALTRELQAALEEEPEDEEPEDEESGGAACNTGTGRRRVRGRFAVELDYKTRVLFWAQLARRVSPSQVAANINDTLAVHAPDKATTMPTVRQVQLMRTELTVASEAIAALRIALAKRIISFGFDESTKYGLGLLSTNVQLEPHDAPGTSEDVVPRGACLIAGGKATEVSAAVEKKIFQHGRVLLRRWKQRHEKLHGEGSWAADGGPDPEALGLHRLTEHTTLVSDTCNAARAAKRLLAEMCEASAQTQIGDEAWQAMGEAERRSKVATYLGDCSGHLRNIVINAMMIKATEYLNAELADDLSMFSSFDRVSLEGIDWIRAAYKEFHGGGEYAKGKGREFIAWLHEHHADAFFMPFENTHGTRMDISFDGMVPIFANRKLMAEFLHQL
eukprot:7389899-Prymnesium_polylepis.1